jgi:hypothetical protein
VEQLELEGLVVEVMVLLHQAHLLLLLVMELQILAVVVAALLLLMAQEVQAAPAL